MGKKNKSGTTKVAAPSGGMRGVVKAKRELMRVLMKIARWKRNQTDPTKVSTWNRKQNPRRRSRHNEWNTEGLEKHAALLQTIIDRGRKVPI